MAGYGMKGLFVAQDIAQVEEVSGEKNTCGEYRDEGLSRADE